MGAIALTPRGRRVRSFFRLLENANFNTDYCIAFIEQLKQNIRGQIVLVWDRFLPHRCKKMQKYLEKQRRVKVHYFPPYAPELNPVEFMWSHLKQNHMANRSCYELNELFKKTKSSLCQIRGEKGLVGAFIRHSPLANAVYH
jgi:transposase